MAFMVIPACLLAELPEAVLTSKASANSLPPSPLRLLPVGATLTGRELHPLKIAAFSRRTSKIGIYTDVHVTGRVAILQEFFVAF